MLDGRARWAVLSAFLAVFSLLFYNVVFGGMSFFERDIAQYFYPMWSFSVSMLKRGIVPLWNPFSCFGQPHLASAPTCVFYPVAWLMAVGDFTRAFNIYIVAHLVLASFFTYLWVRESGYSHGGSFAAGLAYGLSGFMTSSINLTPLLCSAAYLPLALLTFRRALISRGFAWKGICGLVLWFQYLAGDLPGVFGTLLVLLLCAGKEAIHRARDRGTPYSAFGPLLCFATTSLLLAFLSAFHLPLFIELLSRSSRLGMAPDEILRWSMPVTDIPGIAIPSYPKLTLNLVDFWSRQSFLLSYYSGVTVVLLALCTLTGGRRRNGVAFHWALALLGLCLALGRQGGLFPVLSKAMPIFSAVRYPVRFYFICSFGVACLAGMGFDRLVERSTAPLGSGRDRALRYLSLVIAAVCFMLIAWCEVNSARVTSGIIGFIKTLPAWSERPFYYREYVMQENVHDVLMASCRSATLGLLLFAGITGAVFFRPRRALVVFFIILLVTADLGLANMNEPLVPLSAMRERSGNVRIVSEDPGLFRVMPSPRILEGLLYSGTSSATDRLAARQQQLLPSLTVAWSVYNAQLHDPFILKGTGYLIRSAFPRISLPLQQPFLNMLNVRYVVSPREELGDGFTLLNRTRYGNLFRNERALQRAFLAREAVAEKDAERILARLMAADFEPTERIFVESAPPITAETRKQANASGEVSIQQYGPHRIEMRVVVGERPWLFFSDTYYPGWTCRVDGAPARIYKANIAFRAVHLSPGAHTVVWEYDAWLFKAGAAVTIVTLLALIAGILTSRRPGHKPKK